MKDFGYDVSDYCDVDPMFGTLQDFDRLSPTAHELGIKVMIDLVLSHTSTSIPGSSRAGAGTIRRPTGTSGPTPSPMEPRPTTGCRFSAARPGPGIRPAAVLPAQFPASAARPQLPQPEVQEALLDVARFWLERGVDGFRLDTINFYFCDKDLRDNPPLAPELRNASIAPSVNPYNWQDHLYDKNRPENLEFLRKRFPRGDGRVSRNRRGGRGGRRAAGSRSSANTPPATTRCTCATPSNSWRPIFCRRSGWPRC
jgi:alpha-glucosidase